MTIDDLGSVSHSNGFQLDLLFENINKDYVIVTPNKIMLIEGLWTLESRDENFDKFLSCRQVSWFLRTLMTSFKADINYTITATETSSSVNNNDEAAATDSPIKNEKKLIKETISSFGKKKYVMPYPSGTWTPQKTLSGKPETGKISNYESGFIQEMFLNDSPATTTTSGGGAGNQTAGEPIATIHKQVIDNKLHVTLKCQDIICKEVYKRRD